MTLFRSSVEKWRPLVTAYANGKSIEFLLRWLDVESGGYPCDYTYLGEAGIGQLDPSNMASVGTSVDEQHPSPPCPTTLVCDRDPSTGKQTAASCPASSHAITYDDLSDDQRMLQLTPWLAYVDGCINRAQTNLAQYGYNWPENTTSFWCLVKMGHVAPARIPTMLAQGLTANGGVAPADWDSLIATGPFPGVPQNWIDNATSVGSYATDAKLFGTIFGGIIPTWFAVLLGVGGLFASVFLIRKVKRRYPRVWTKLHLPEKVPLLSGLPDPSDDAWDVAADAIMDHQPKKAAQVWASIRKEHGFVTAPPSFLKALHEAPWDVRWKFEDYVAEYAA